MRSKLFSNLTLRHSCNYLLAESNVASLSYSNAHFDASCSSSIRTLLYLQYNFALSPKQMSQLPVLTEQLCPNFHTERTGAGYVVMTLVAAAKSSAVLRYGSAKQYLREVRERKRDAKKRYKQIKIVAKQKHLTYTKPELLLTCLGSNTLGTQQYGGAGEQLLLTVFNGFLGAAVCKPAIRRDARSSVVLCTRDCS
jgi:hypothetical protein